ncbi:Transposon Ty3-I Gag-Pol polyprotein [Gossypium australe]|uniref:Transposon Ty3-I Gag-Pol polyprotein n=1 Tax=Gossypium australe TaxID=47621 RepID=A0A5B6WD93_9ROSI|nr:Transposon Ty3-I Gag-Pol polyprotein [Gossypium australe]
METRPKAKGHSGTTTIRHRMTGWVYLKGMSKDINRWVKECDVCQKNKYDLLASPGFLQSLSVPIKVWADISMDFIDELLVLKGKDTIWVVVDRLMKYGHFLALAHPY